MNIKTLSHMAQRYFLSQYGKPPPPQAAPPPQRGGESNPLLFQGGVARSAGVVCLIAIIFASSSLRAADAGTALKADSLRAEPFSDAKTVGNISRDDKLEIMDKKGAWLKVKSTKSTGWVRLLSVKRGEASKSGSNADVLALANGRSGTGKVVSTTGVRGLNEEELKAAKFNEQEVSQLEGYAVSRDAAQQFAAQGSLTARKLDYLPSSKLGAQP